MTLFCPLGATSYSIHYIPGHDKGPGPRRREPSGRGPPRPRRLRRRRRRRREGGGEGGEEVPQGEAAGRPGGHGAGAGEDIGFLVSS